MKQQFLLLTLLVFAFSSCGQDKDDENPSGLLEGTYTFEKQFTDDGPVYSESVIFKANRGILIEYYIVPINSTERCLRGYSEGVYSLQGEEFTLTLSSSFGPDPVSYNFSDGCIAKEDLVYNLNPDFKVRMGSLIMDNSNESFVLSYPCNDVIGSMANCIGAQTYFKQD